MLSLNPQTSHSSMSELLILWTLPEFLICGSVMLVFAGWTGWTADSYILS
jgi:hypothetical protein